AIADFNKVVKIRPHSLVYNSRGAAWFRKENYDKAIADYTSAIEKNPGFDKAYFNRGFAWATKAVFDKAVSDYKKAVELNPAYKDAYNQLAWLLAVCPDKKIRDGSEAVKISGRLVKLDRTPDFLDTLAAAYAEAGKFKEAVSAQKEAIALIEKQGDYPDLAEYVKRLKAYEAFKPPL
ncbi:MAG: tetratricopeptide repeat protein, partial [Desulfobulbaceae bacterium]|nr:tetratricopeptide repeat protein [Desulfobulbaceae bacterium]